MLGHLGVVVSHDLEAVWETVRKLGGNNCYRIPLLLYMPNGHNAKHFWIKNTRHQGISRKIGPGAQAC